MCAIDFECTFGIHTHRHEEKKWEKQNEQRRFLISFVFNILKVSHTTCNLFWWNRNASSFWSSTQILKKTKAFPSFNRIQRIVSYTSNCWRLIWDGKRNCSHKGVWLLCVSCCCCTEDRMKGNSRAMMMLWHCLHCPSMEMKMKKIKWTNYKRFVGKLIYFVTDFTISSVGICECREVKYCGVRKQQEKRTIIYLVLLRCAFVRQTHPCARDQMDLNVFVALEYASIRYGWSGCINWIRTHFFPYSFSLFVALHFQVYIQTIWSTVFRNFNTKARSND